MDKSSMIYFLAIYGAIVGTIALILNFLRYRQAVHTNSVKLKVNYKKVKNFKENIISMQKGYDPLTGTGGSLAKIYEVEIQNLGSVVAYIEEVGIVCDNGEKHIALVRDPSFSSSHVLTTILNIKVDELKPKSAQTFYLYLNKSEELFEAKYAYVVDQTGKEWK